MTDEEAAPAERCYASAMRILNLRWNSVVELRRKLARKDFEPEVIEETLARLTAEKWLDDERFAAAFTRGRARKRIGSRRIVRELGAAGVATETAERIARETVDPVAERDAMVALCQKKMRMIARRHGDDALHSDDVRKKLSAYLLNHGYEMGDVIDVVRECTRKTP